MQNYLVRVIPSNAGWSVIYFLHFFYNPLNIERSPVVVVVLYNNTVVHATICIFTLYKKVAAAFVASLSWLTYPS